MKITFNWLNEYVKIDDLTPQFICERLLNIGLEVESLTYLGEGIDKIVTARVEEIKSHPSSARLNICKINTGSEILQIITAATNVQKGDIVCAALVGASLPDGKVIATADFKGITSFGMLCGLSELGADKDNLDIFYAPDSDGTSRNDKDGLLILPSDTKLGRDVKEILGLNDYLLDISITANRADCHSVYGIARELAATLKRPLNPLDLSFNTYKSIKASLNVCVKDKSLCTRYMGSFIDDVRVQPSPLWLRRRLKACGHSSYNNIVDITNYVLLEVGQPLHAFDQSIIKEGIIVRKALKDERLTLLDDTAVTLNQNMLLIADHEKPLALAGIMGGKQSGIYDNTTSVFLESARFSRGNIRSTARALGLKSDSSQRFEKGIDYLSPDIGRKRALSLMDKLGVGKIADLTVCDQTKEPQAKIINLNPKSFKEILGISIPTAFIKDILTRLDFKVDSISNEIQGKSEKILQVKVPNFREDIDNFTDLIEEAVRFYGYDKLTESSLKTPLSTDVGISTKRQNILKIEELCTAIGGYEINNYSFIPSKHLDMLNLLKDDILRQAIRIINPLSEEYAYMRTQLVSGMLETIRRNQSRQNVDFILFEIDNVFLPHSLPLTELPNENLTLCMGFCHKKVDFYYVKAFVRQLLDTFDLEYDFKFTNQSYLHPGKSAAIFIDKKHAGDFGMIHPLVQEGCELTLDTYVLHIDLSGFIDRPLKTVRFCPLLKFPYVERDLSVVLKQDYPAGEVVNLIKNSDPLIKEVRVFDVYTGSQIESGFKSIALKLVLQNADKTMTEQEINLIMAKILTNLKNADISLRL